MDCLTEVLEIKTLLEIIQFDLKKIMPNSIKWDKFISIYKKAPFHSDLIFLYEIINKIKEYFSDSFTFSTNQSKTKVLLDQHFNETLNKFKKLKLKNKEIPTNFDSNLWNKFSNLQNNGNLQRKYKKVLQLDKSTSNLILINKNKIDNWANSNFLNPYVISKLIEKLGKLYLTKIIFEENQVFTWANDLKINYMKHLTTGTIEERIIRSFIYGRPFQFSFSKFKTQPCTIINRNINSIQFRETLVEKSTEMIFFINFYKQDNDLPDNLPYITSILSKIDLEWLIPAVPLFMNKLSSIDIIIDENSEITFMDSEYIQQMKRTLINNWNKNKVLWNSENLPVMKHFYNNISKILSTNSY